MLERVYLEPEESPAVSISSDVDVASTESNGKYDSGGDSDVDMRMEDDVDTPDGIHLDEDVDIKRHGDHVEDDEEEDEKEEDEKGEVLVDGDEEEDEDEDNGKEPRTIGQGEMRNLSADDADMMVDDQPTVFPVQGREMGKHTPCPQLLATAQLQQTLDPRSQPRSLETHNHSGLEFWGI